MPAQVRVPPELAGQPQGGFAAAGLARELQRRPQVRPLRVQPVQFLFQPLRAPFYQRPGLLGELGEVPQVGPPRRFLLGGPGQPLLRVVADGGQQVVARAAVRLLRAQQRLFGQPGQQVEDVPAGDAAARRDPFGGGQGEAAGKDREPPEHRALVRGEQVVAPVEGRAQRLMAARRRAGPAGQYREDVVQALRQLCGRQDPYPRGGQLDRQRQAVQATADLQDRGGVVVGDAERRPDQLGPLFEEADRVRAAQRGRGRRDDGATGRQRQRRDRPAAFSLDAERLAAGGEDRQRRAGDQQPLGEAGHRGGQVLAVVQHDQRPPAGHVRGDRLGGVLSRRVRRAELAGHRLADDRGIGGRREFHPADPAGEGVTRDGGGGQRQPRLAGPAGAGQGEQPGGGQFLPHIAQFAGPAHQ